uniref:Uncharacterized protein n=1 Tax=Steinernema glaseri TaxID=37863 RepID=A0A1I7Y682_9BILA
MCDKDLVVPDVKGATCLEPFDRLPQLPIQPSVPFFSQAKSGFPAKPEVARYEEAEAPLPGYASQEVDLPGDGHRYFEDKKTIATHKKTKCNSQVAREATGREAVFEEEGWRLKSDGKPAKILGSAATDAFSASNESPSSPTAIHPRDSDKLEG